MQNEQKFQQHHHAAFSSEHEVAQQQKQESQNNNNDADDALVTVRTHQAKDYYRTQTSAVNLQLIQESEESFDVLQGTESLVLTEAELWRKRCNDALAKFSKCTNEMLDNYGVASEMLEGINNNNNNSNNKIQMQQEQNENENESENDEENDEENEENQPNRISTRRKQQQHQQQKRKQNNLPTLEEMSIPPLSLDDQSDIALVLNAADSSIIPEVDTIKVSPETEVKLERLTTNLSVAHTRSYEDYCSHLRELRIATRGALSSHKRRSEVAESLQETAKILLPSTLPKFDPVPIILNLSAAYQHDPLSEIRSEVGESQSKVEELEAQLQHKTRERASSAVAEHFILVEELNEECTEIYQKMMKMSLEAYDNVNHSSEDVKEFLSNVGSIEVTLTGMESSINQQEQLEESAERDIAILQQQVESRNARSENSHAEVRLETDRITGELDSLQQSRTTLWNEIMEKFKQFGSITEKMGIARQQIQNVVSKNAAREAQHLRELHSLKKYIATRKCVSTNAKKGTEILRATKSYAADMLQLIFKKEHENQRQKLGLEQCVKFYDTYASYVSHLQECASKKEARLENSRRLRRSINFQVEAATNCFDPNVPKYRDQLLQLSELVEEMEVSVKKIQLELHEGYYRGVWNDKIQPILSAKKIPFDEPTQRAQHLRLEMLQKQFEAVDSFQREEQHVLDEERRVVRVLRNLAASEKRGAAASVARASISAGRRASSAAAIATSSGGGSGTSSRRSSVVAAQALAMTHSEQQENNNNNNNNDRRSPIPQQHGEDNNNNSEGSRRLISPLQSRRSSRVSILEEPTTTTKEQDEL